MPRTVILNVKLRLPPGASKEDACAYVKDAVTGFAGSLRPPGSISDDDDGDPFFRLDRESVVVK